MYCSSCGVAVAQSLSYCNYCGAKVNGAKGESAGRSPEVKPETLVAAMVLVFVFGLGAISLFMGMMKAVLHLNEGVILFFILLSFLIMLSLEGVIVRLLMRRKGGHEEAGDAGLMTRELNAGQPRGLPESMPSVTEHTTRAFEPLYNERKSK